MSALEHDVLAAARTLGCLLVERDAAVDGSAPCSEKKGHRPVEHIQTDVALARARLDALCRTSSLSHERAL